MKDLFNSVLDYEFDLLLEALRRDVRAESMKALQGDVYAEMHRQNAKRSVRLLEALNPKKTKPYLRHTHRPALHSTSTDSFSLVKRLAKLTELV